MRENIYICLHIFKLWKDSCKMKTEVILRQWGRSGQMGKECSLLTICKCKLQSLKARYKKKMWYISLINFILITCWKDSSDILGQIKYIKVHFTCLFFHFCFSFLVFDMVQGNIRWHLWLMSYLLEGTAGQKRDLWTLFQLLSFPCLDHSSLPSIIWKLHNTS